MMPPKDTSIGKGYYKLDIYFFSPDLKILKTLHIRKDTIFLQVKKDLLEALDGDEFYNIDQLNSFYELGVCFDWDGKNYDKMTFPDEFASVVPTISQMEFNSFGKIRMIYIDTRQYWRMKYLKEDINEWRVWKPIDSVGSSVLFEPPSQMTIQEHLQMELSNIATFQGKLQRKYELNKKQEVWRDVWCMLMKDRLWFVPLGNSLEREATNFNLPLSVALNDETVVTEHLNRDKLVFSISTVIVKDMKDKNGTNMLLSVPIRKEVFRAKDETTAKQWTSLISYQHINHHSINHRVPSLRLRIGDGAGNTSQKPRQQQNTESDNDVFYFLEQRITEEQKIHSYEELNQYNTIYSCRKMLYHSEVRSRFQHYLTGRELDILFKLWQYIEDFKLSYPHSTLNYTTFQSLLTPLAPKSSKLVGHKAEVINQYAYSIYEVMVSQTEEIKKILDFQLLEELYIILKQNQEISLEVQSRNSKDSITSENQTLPTPNSPSSSSSSLPLVSLTIFDKIFHKLWKMLEKLFYDGFCHLTEFRSLIITLQTQSSQLNPTQKVQKLMQEIKSGAVSGGRSSTTNAGNRSQINSSISEKSEIGNTGSSRISSRVASLFRLGNRTSMTSGKEIAKPLPLEEPSSNSNEHLILKFTESAVLRIREQIQRVFPPTLTAPESTSNPRKKQTSAPATPTHQNYYSIGANMTMNEAMSSNVHVMSSSLQMMPESWWYLLEQYENKSGSSSSQKIRTISNSTATNEGEIISNIGHTTSRDSTDSTSSNSSSKAASSISAVIIKSPRKSQPHLNASAGSFPSWYPANILSNFLARVTSLPNFETDDTIFHQNEFFHFPLIHYLQTLSLPHSRSNEINVELEYEEKHKDLLHFHTCAFPIGFTQEDNGGGSPEDRKSSKSATASKDIQMINYYLNTVLKDLGVIVFMGIVKVDYFPSRCIPLDQNLLISKAISRFGANEASNRINSKQMSPLRGSPIPAGDGGNYSPFIERKNSNGNSSAPSMLIPDDRWNSNRSLMSVDYPVSPNSYASNMPIQMLSSAFSSGNNINTNYEEDLYHHFYSNPAFLSEDFLQLLLFNYYKNHFNSKGYRELMQQQALMPFPNISNSGSVSPVPVSTPTDDQVQNQLPSSSLPALTSGGSATSSNNSYLKHANHHHFHHPESLRGPTGAYNYISQLKQWMIITSTSDGQLHLYCFDLLTNAVTLHLLLHEQRLIRPTKTILHSFQVMDEFHNIYQFTFSDSFITPSAFMIATAAGVGGPAAAVGGGGPNAGGGSVGVSSGGASGKAINENNLLEIAKSHISQLLYVVFEYNEVIHSLRQNELLSSTSTNSSNRSPNYYCKPKVVLIIKQGWLQKRGRINTSYKNRFFVLTNDFKLRYFKDDTNHQNYSNFKGMIDLTLTDYDESNRFNSIVCFDKDIIINMKKRKGRVWTIRAESNVEGKEWVEVLNELLFQFYSLNSPNTGTGGKREEENTRTNSHHRTSSLLNLPNGAHFSDDEEEEGDDEDD